MSFEQIRADVSAGLAEVAAELGNGGTFVTILRPAAQPDNPWGVPVGSPTPYAVRAAVEQYSQGQIDGTLIQADDVRVLVEVPPIVPNKSDRVEVSGGPYAGEYAIVSVNAEAPAGEALLYILQCRK